MLGQASLYSRLHDTQVTQLFHLPNCYYATTGDYWAITPQLCYCFNNAELQAIASYEMIKSKKRKLKLKWSGQDWIFVGIK